MLGTFSSEDFPQVHCAVATLGPEAIAELLRYERLFRHASEVEPGLVSVNFQGHWIGFFESINDRLVADGEQPHDTLVDLVEDGSSRGVELPDNDVDYAEGPIRMGVVTLVVSDTGVRWEASLKHTCVMHETHEITWEQLKGEPKPVEFAGTEYWHDPSEWLESRIEVEEGLGNTLNSPGDIEDELPPNVSKAYYECKAAGYEPIVCNDTLEKVGHNWAIVYRDTEGSDAGDPVLFWQEGW